GYLTGWLKAKLGLARYVFQHFFDKPLGMQSVAASRLNDAHLAAQHVSLAEGFAVVNPLEECRVGNCRVERLVTRREPPFVALGERHGRERDKQFHHL